MGGSCDVGKMCAEDTFCYIGYTYWTALIGTSSKMNHTDFCSLYWNLALMMMGEQPDEECLYYMEKYDYNEDGMLNFRESVPFVYDGARYSFEGNTRGPQINCSLCIGMDL